ncbi:MAG: hypothetical protein GY716_09475 [bacterium]|nr:hypothetical protein [bacterium]
MSHITPETLERFDELADGPRADVLDHAASCASCRRRLIADDPSRLFALLAVDPIPAEALDRLSSRVSAGIDRGDAPRRGDRRLVVAASLAASLLLAGTLLVFGLRGPGLGAPAFVADRTADAGLIQLRAAAPLDGIELISTRGDDAQVVDMNLGGTQIVMIFDEELGL